jgi:hypothetical protein
VRQRFTDNAETLILIATSHFELHERGYETLLTRTRSLGDAHRTAIALVMPRAWAHLASASKRPTAATS